MICSRKFESRLKALIDQKNVEGSMNFSLFLCFEKRSDPVWIVFLIGKIWGEPWKSDVEVILTIYLIIDSSLEMLSLMSHQKIKL